MSQHIKPPYFQSYDGTVILPILFFIARLAQPLFYSVSGFTYRLLMRSSASAHAMMCP